jgi:hypothetical protein
MSLISEGRGSVGAWKKPLSALASSLVELRQEHAAVSRA